MMLLNSGGDVVLQADSKQHLIAEILVFFECNDFAVDFKTGKARVAEVDCEVIDYG